MEINKVCIVLIGLIVFIGVIGVNSNNNTVYGAEKDIKPLYSSVNMTNLYATIHIHIKNNNNHVQYFKISQTYTDHLTGPINWVIKKDSISPPALNMIDSVSQTGDLGWKIQPGQTKEVTFTILAVDSSGAPLRFAIGNQQAVANTYWPIIPDPGLYPSWFQPNEIEMLNPSLDLKVWQGHFSFDLINIDPHGNTVSGIIRAPIVPINSKLISSKPKATFLDNDMVLGGKVAAWDVTIGSTPLHYQYTYLWPSSSSSSSSGQFKSIWTTTNAASSKVPVSTKETGVPYLPFVIGGILVAGGLAYARIK